MEMKLCFFLSSYKINALELMWSDSVAVVCVVLYSHSSLSAAVRNYHNVNDFSSVSDILECYP